MIESTTRLGTRQAACRAAAKKKEPRSAVLANCLNHLGYRIVDKLADALGIYTRNQIVTSVHWNKNALRFASRNGERHLLGNRSKQGIS